MKTSCFLLTWTRGIIDERKLQQRTKNERQTHASPYVNGFCIRYGWQRCIDTWSLSCHSEKGCDAEWYSSRHSSLIKPKWNPWHDYQHTARRVDLNQIIRKLPFEKQIHFEAAVFTWEQSNDESLIIFRLFFLSQSARIKFGIILISFKK